MEQLQAIVLPENAHNTATSGLLKKIKVLNTYALSLTPCILCIILAGNGRSTTYNWLVICESLFVFAAESPLN